jgi:gamma-glutamyltranspeptidase/glutathione hydrolase
MQRSTLSIACLVVSLLANSANAQALVSYRAIHHPEYSRNGMVAAQNRIPAEIGAAVLADGGNAVDAAVAVGFALAVTLPRAGNIGGGGFMLVYDAESGETTAIDYREMAPLGATRDMFLDADGNPDPSLSRDSHLASGVPGTVAGLYFAHQEFGRLPWERVVQPSVELARDGIIVTHDLATQLKRRQSRLCRDATSCRYFYKPGGVPYEMGERLVQSDLADTLQLIAEQGSDAFYKGEIARKIAAEMASGNGLIDRESLAAYQPAVREPLRGNYRGYEIVTMPPTSSGGVHILQMLNILEHFPIADFGAGSANEIHVLAEVMRLAYADRSEHLGDPDFYDVPVEWLTSAGYAAELAASIDMDRARASTDVKPGVPVLVEGEDTTHFSIADVHGNFVTNTYTINTSYGSAISVEGAGFLLNNEMEDFVSKPGVPNVFGLLGGEANAVEALKRPLSSMTPFIVFNEDGKPWFSAGSPGGSRIITAVLQMIVNMIDHGRSLADALAMPRIHHQWFPDKLQVESLHSPDTLSILRARGHDVNNVQSTFTSLQAVAIVDGIFQGAADSRRPDAAAVAPARINVDQD